MQQAHGDRLDGRGTEDVGDAFDLGGVHRSEPGAVRRRPLGDAEPEPTGHKRRWSLEEEVVKVEPVLLANRETVDEPGGREQRDAGTRFSSFWKG